MCLAPRFCAALAAAALACTGGDAPRPPEGAALLFDVRFDAPDEKPGSAPKVYEPGATHEFPSRIVTQVFMGRPLVVDALCGLAQQPLRLTTATGTTGHEGIELLLDQRYARYHVELSLCVAQLGPPPLPANEPQLAVFLDFPAAHAVGFYADGKLGLLDPARALEGKPPSELVGAWSPGVPLRLALDVDLETRTWRIAVDGKPMHEGPVDMYLPRAVRVVVRGNESNAAALDDVVIWAEKDLTAGTGQSILAPKVGDD